MAEVARAEVRVVPKFTGFKASVESEIAKTQASGKEGGAKLGAAFGSGASGGLGKSGAIVGAFSAITNKALGSISSHLGDAVSRFDTLNNYPKVMQQLGYSSQDAEASIGKMSDRLQNLPTTLDSMVSTVQGIVTTTKDLGKATDVSLALNDMLVASGSNQQLVNAAMEQFRQILAKGKPDMQDWKSLTSAMPGQMDQLAKAMLGPTANATDLYQALGGGGHEATVTMDQLMDKMVELDTEGGGSFASFQEQAESAAGGVATSVANMGNAVTKGITGVFDAIGQENIAGFFNDVKGGINQFFGVVQQGAKVAVPAIMGAYNAVKPLAPLLLESAAAFSVANSALGRLAPAASRLDEAFKLAKGGAGTFAEALGAVGFSVNPMTAALAVGSVAVVGIGTAIADYQEKAGNAQKATSGLADAASRLGSLDSYGGSIRTVGENAGFTAISVDELNKRLAEQADSMGSAAESAESQIGQLNGAVSVIQQYAGQTDLTAQEQGRLEAALRIVNDALGTTIDSSDVAKGSWEDQSGAVQNLTSDLDNLIEKKRQQIKLDALQGQASTAWDNYSAACDTAAKAQDDYNRACEDYINKMVSQGHMTREQAQANIDNGTALKNERNELDRAKDSMESAKGAYDSITDAIGDTTQAASEGADAYDKWGNTVDQYTSSLLNASTKSSNGLGRLKEDLRALGASTEDLGKLSSEQLQELAQCYDGTSASIVGKLQEWGVGMDDAAVKAAQSVTAIMDALNGMDLGGVFEDVGVDVNAFSDKLAQAGVSAEDLNAIGSANIAALANRFGGDTDKMIASILAFNGTGMLDKDSQVNVDDIELRTAQGDLVEWNGTAFVKKGTDVEVDDQELVDAQGRVYTWNGSRLVPKSTSANANGNIPNGSAQGNVDSFRGALSRIPRTVTSHLTATADTSMIDYFKSKVVSVMGTYVAHLIVGNAAGGIRPHADGGFVPRYHANGAIATKAMPLDIVGEAGAEAIVPLTNTKYSRPFAKTIAEQMRGYQQDDTAIRAAEMIIDALPQIIERYTPVMGQRDFNRKVRAVR